MELNEIGNFLIWYTVIDYGFLVVWFAAFVFAGDWIYRLHGKWFPMPRETFNAVFYSFIGMYKIVVFVFNVVPWAVLAIIG